LSGYLFLLPAAVFFVTFVLYPMIDAALLSAYNYNGIVKTFTGVANYFTLFNDETFRKSLPNIILLVAMDVPLTAWAF
jgi:multiple sugar transport system permease protein